TLVGIADRRQVWTHITNQHSTRLRHREEVDTPWHEVNLAVPGKQAVDSVGTNEGPGTAILLQGDLAFLRAAVWKASLEGTILPVQRLKTKCQEVLDHVGKRSFRASQLLKLLQSV